VLKEKSILSGNKKAFLKNQIGWLRKKSICGVALQLRRCGAPVNAPHSSVFARLASGALYAAIGLLTFYEIIKLEMIPFFFTRTPTPEATLDFWSKNPYDNHGSWLSFPGRQDSGLI